MAVLYLMLVILVLEITGPFLSPVSAKVVNVFSSEIVSLPEISIVLTL
jgi:hypothetical protein